MLVTDVEKIWTLFQRNCAVAFLIIPTTLGAIAADQTETFCGDYLNLIEGSIAGGVVPCEWK